MTLKNRIKTYNFWVSLSSAIFLLLKVLGNQFGFKVDESLFSDLFTSLCGILVILGIIVPPTSKINYDAKFSLNNEEQKSNNSVTQSSDETSKNNDEQSPLNENLSSSDLILEEENIKTENTNDQNNENVLEYTNEEKTDINKLNIENEIFDSKIQNEDTIINENLNYQECNEIDKLILDFHQVMKNQESIFSSNQNLYIELLEKEINYIKKQNI